MNSVQEISQQLAVEMARPERESLWHIEAGLRTAADEWQDAVQHLANFDESKLLQDGGVTRELLVAEVERTEAVLRVFLKAEIVKVNGICHVIRSWRGEIAEAGAEKKRVALIEERRQNALNCLMGFVLSVMQDMGEKKLATPTNTLRRQNNPPSLEVFDVLQVPAEFMKAHVTMPLQQWRDLIAATPLLGTAFEINTEYDGGAIREALKAGREVPGARMVTDREHLRVV